ncbi:MAG: amino acid adenylation domain-containing protein [Actinomycetota bacterium]|nr:amino acid adenylation domain-containing protein [Actinomycetota bacterium]
MTQLESTQQASEPFVLPASFAQQRMWFLQRLEGGAVYNVPSATRLRGPLDFVALERSLTTIIERHESLRTIFQLVDGVPHQVVLPPEPVALESYDISDHADAAERALEMVSEQARTSFDLSCELPIRLALIKLADEDHVLTLTLHHIVSDAWSMGVLGRELGELYGGLLSGHSVELPELPIQYADYAAWQREWLTSGGLDQQLGYWRQKLAGAPNLLELPTDKPRPAEQSFSGRTLRTERSRELLERVQEISQRERTTVFMTLLAVFAALLARYSRQDDVVVATPVAGRDRVELEPMIGLFVNTLALRVQLDDDPTFLQLLERVRETSLEALSNQDVPFDQLVQELRPQRSRSHPPIAQVMFVMQGGVQPPLALDGLEHERIQSDRGTAKFDLAMFAGEAPDGLRIAIEYCTDLFEAGTIERMLDHYHLLLDAALADPDCPVSRLPMLSEAERELILRQWAAGEPRPEPARPVHELVSDQARLTPDAAAVTFGDRELTYRELETRAQALAARLLELGVKRDVVVGIAAERSIEMAVAVLAVLKAGGAYGPIDPAYPADRVAFMLADSDAPVLLTQKDLLERLPEHRARTICLDDPATFEPPDREVPAEPATPDQLAYVIYTSGSTGRPKGVAMGHGPLANLIAWQLESLRQPVAARTLQFASLSFDVAFQELFSTWCSGGTLVLIDEQTRRDPDALLRTLRDREIERLFVPFVALQSLCEAAERAVAWLPALREVIAAGEQLKASTPVRRFFARHPGCVLLNHYGPSETHVVSSYELPEPPDAWPALPPIGRPIAGAKVYILDEHREPVPIGVPGELYAGGACVARGYLKRPELTAERFLEDPFSGAAGARMYRTGDLGRHLPGGDIAFLGRADDQIKIRGFRVELGEVESIVASHPAVAEAVAALHHHGEVARLVAYVVPRDGVEVDPYELQAHARRVAPDYMVPQQIVVVGRIALTPSGKIDRRALPVPNGQVADVRRVPPHTELERALADIWRRLLGLEEVGVEDDFFELGGHSLLAVQLAHAVQDELGRTCTLPMVFRDPTIRALASELRAGGVDATEPAILQLARGTGPNVICLVGVHAYQELAEELAPDYSVFGVFLPVEQEIFSGRSRDRAPTIEQMAAWYVDTVRELQPHGPYFLVGFCFGGVLAYEVAQQLMRAGEEVGSLVMLDSTLRSIMRRRPDRLATRLRRRAVTRSDVLPRSIQRKWLGEEFVSETMRLDRVRRRVYGRAMRRYHVRPYPARAVLVRPEGSAAAYKGAGVDESWGWAEQIKQLELESVTGDHHSHLKQPHVHRLARIVRAHLERAQRGAGSQGA